jgi:Fic family protein
MKALDRARGAFGQMDAVAKQLNDPYIVSRILTRREAVSSSSIEGTQSTLDELLSVEETGGDGSEDAARQVRNYALHWTISSRRDQERLRGLMVDLLKDLHRTVMKDNPDYQDKPGEFRARRVDRRRWQHCLFDPEPSPPAEIAACIEQTVDYLRNEGMQQMNQSLLTRMAIAYAHFEAVHPFRDGNGRVGRLLLPLMMAAEGHVPLYLSPYIESRKGAYYDSLKDAQQRLDYQSLIGFMADAVTGTVGELMKTRTALSALSEQWKERRKFRKGSAAARALEELPHYPVVTAKRLGELLSISPPQVHQAIAQLEEAGILAERTGYARNRIYAANEAMNIINRPFGEEPILPHEATAEDEPAADL